jgi:ABC-type Mn2+/Zn2+ transport system permease subunit
MASSGLCWWIGLAIAPTLGAQLLSRSPAAMFLASAAVTAAAVVSSLTLERRLPAATRLTPGRQRTGAGSARQGARADADGSG